MCWVLECLPQWQGTIEARRDLGGSSSQLACESCFHLQHIARIGADAKQPLRGRSFHAARNQC
jgi:hypothetical protein